MNTELYPETYHRQCRVVIDISSGIMPDLKAERGLIS